MLLNKKQVSVGWIMILLVTALIFGAIFAMPEELSGIKIFHYFYFFILILGFILIYAFRDKKK